MHPLFHFLKRWKCKSVFHKVALDALQGLDGETGPQWQSLFLWRIEPFLKGVDAPREEFRDFTNHSFDPEEPWGAAPRLAAKWYDQTLEAFRAGDWTEGVHNAGVMLRYCAYSVLLFHGQHRDPGLSRRELAAWCLARHDERLGQPLDHGEEANASRWRGQDLESFLALAAQRARGREERIFHHLNADLFAHDPPTLNEELRGDLAEHLEHVRRTLAAIMRRVVEEIETPPRAYPIGFAYGAALGSLPIFWLTRSRWRSTGRRTIDAMRREWAAAGHIRDTLSAECRAVGDAHAIAHGGDPDAERPGLTRPPHLTDAIPFSIARDQPRLEPPSFDPITPASSIREATSIRGELADQLAKHGMRTVRDLLGGEPEEIAAKLAPRASAADVCEWRDEAALCCEIPLLAPVEAQLLVACGVTGRRDLAALSPVELWELVIPVAESPDGARILGRSPVPNLDTVTEWIQAARLRAA